MALGDRTFNSGAVATATVATLATLSKKNRAKLVGIAPNVASVADVAVSENMYIPPLAVIPGGAGIKSECAHNLQEVPLFNDPLPELPNDSQEWGNISCDHLPSCFSCHHYDGKGTAWPGMCRYFETIGESAKEIDSGVVDVDNGCKCYKARAVEPVASNTHRPQRGDDLRWMPPTDSSPTKSKAKKKKPSPVAINWLKDHRQELKSKGWTMPELYRRNKSQGLAWVALWNKKTPEITIKTDGVIVFQYFNNARQKITQTARPMMIRRETPHEDI
ncbi:MAG: hypothetical protein PF495_03040 [Spirochaetales bacterium]|jgi:hypothetical protein|nr:hypothetical protein [Spirochaetales bacterium]